MMLRPRVQDKPREDGRGRLIVITTPLGRAEDITLRAARALLSARWIACEDTRVTRKLICRLKEDDLKSLFGIQAGSEAETHYLSVREANEAEGAQKVIRIIENGEDVLYCTDAGSPGVSDPGRVLVEQVRQAGYQVQVFPGASAVTASLALSGMSADRFYFAGFLPAKASARRRALEEIKRRVETIVLFEAPHRMQELMADTSEICGDRDVVICREMTKEHEEIVRTVPSEAAKREDWRGEITIVMAGAPSEQAPVSTLDIEEFLKREIAGGATVRDAVDETVKVLGVSKREAYKMALGLKAPPS